MYRAYIHPHPPAGRHVSATAGVMASDSLATEEDSPPGTLRRFGRAADCYAGQLSIRDPLRNAIDAYLASTPLTNLPEAMVA